MKYNITPEPGGVVLCTLSADFYRCIYDRLSMSNAVMATKVIQYNRQKI